MGEKKEKKERKKKEGGEWVLGGYSSIPGNRNHGF